MTAPMIGNYGVNAEDMESDRPQVSGIVVRELSRHPSNWRSDLSLDQWLAEAGVPVVEGVDTRRLTRHIRERGAMRGVLAEGRQPSRELTAHLLASRRMEGLDLVMIRIRESARFAGRYLRPNSRISGSSSTYSTVSVSCHLSLAAPCSERKGMSRPLKT